MNYIKKIEKDVVIIEYVKTILGIGNYLYDNLKSIQRIMCLSKND